MADQDSEQNKTEEATPFKLNRAREKGMVARSLDLGYFGALAALAGFIAIAGEALAFKLAQLMRQTLSSGIGSAADPRHAQQLIGTASWPAIQAVALLGGSVLLLVILLDIVQLRGIVFSAQPLKPDFSRINPAKGLKRLLSMRMLKEALKNILKLAAYSAVTAIVIFAFLEAPGRASADAQGLISAMHSGGLRLLFLFVTLALGFAALDQFLVRRDFAKQMRMSRREVTRESREREGEPRLKQKRKQLHQEFVKQSQGIGKLPGSDVVVVNPQHYAVALAYDSKRMDAPTVTAKARNHFALALKREAFRLGIPIVENPPLARALFQDCEPDREVGPSHYRAVADLYLKLRAPSLKQAEDDNA